MKYRLSPKDLGIIGLAFSQCDESEKAIIDNIPLETPTLVKQALVEYFKGLHDARMELSERLERIDVDRDIMWADPGEAAKLLKKKHEADDDV